MKEIYSKLVNKVEDIIRSFSLTEKIFFNAFCIILAISAILILINVNKSFLVDIPENGGILSEGVIGTPRFINPLIAISSADKDLTALIYSGLTRKTADGDFIGDLAERYEISDDGLEYRFFLRRNATFHDGTPVTTDDVVYTILKAQDPEIESPRRPEWEGVSIEKISDIEIVFRLKQPYAPFIENTTIGILPRHLWENIVSGGFSLSKFNTEPIGSGPYKLDKISRDSTDIPESYTLVAFKNYTLGKPFLNKIVFNFVKNENDLVEKFKSGVINSFGGIRPEVANTLKNEGVNLQDFPLPRIFGLFFNQSESRVLTDSAVRRALEVAISKEEIVNQVLFGYGEIADNSIPPSLESGEILNASSTDDITNPTQDELIKQAQEILENNDWKKNADGIYEKTKDKEKFILSLSISTNNVPELVSVAEKIVEIWKSVGVDASVKVFETSDLNQTVIRPRNFEVLLFGMVIKRYPDLYAFWHSSQRVDPGLNITNYANITTDKLLSDLREISDEDEIQKAVAEFNENIKADRPAIFLYTPKFIYVIPKEINGIKINNITGGEDRFMNIYKWYVDTDHVWKIFN